ncbi:MAG: rhomboid family intramembrane serine protease [Bacteroidales bacterium]
MSVTLVIIAITCIMSFMAFNNVQLFYRCKFLPYDIIHKKQYYRVLSHVLLHANGSHLLVNMFVLYSFGKAVETSFANIWGQSGIIYFIILYITGAIVSSTPALFKHKNNIYYSAVGASGAVAAVVSSYIILYPWSKLYLFFAIPIPAIIFGVLYVGFSWYMSKRDKSLVAHDAHLIGSLWGFIFPVLLDSRIAINFIHSLLYI